MKSDCRIVTLGGGTGGPSVIRSLVLAGFSQISAVSAATDSGGRTGIIRSDERDRVIAVSDLLRTLLALISPDQNHLTQVEAFTELAGFTDGRNRNLGYTIYYALLEKYDNDFLLAEKHLERLLNIKFHGTAIPVTLSPAHICFSTASGAEYSGEHELDRLSMSTNTITKIWLDKKVPATPLALQAIASATHIIFCPGSLYGSVLANFLPVGVTTALKKSQAQKILITNLVSDRNQTHAFTPDDYLRIFREYTGLPRPFDHVVSPHLTNSGFNRQFPQIAANYAHEHSFFLGWEDRDFAGLVKLGITIHRADVHSITTHLGRIRHDPEKLSPILKQIIQTDN